MPVITWHFWGIQSEQLRCKLFDLSAQFPSESTALSWALKRQPVLKSNVRYNSWEYYNSNTAGDLRDESETNTICFIYLYICFIFNIIYIYYLYYIKLKYIKSLQMCLKCLQISLGPDHTLGLAALTVAIHQGSVGWSNVSNVALHILWLLWGELR